MLEPSYLDRPAHPIRDVLKAMTGKAPPKFVKGYSIYSLTDEEWDKLQSWAVNACRPSWLTGIGLLEAAEHQVQEAVSNGNIPREEGLTQTNLIHRGKNRVTRALDDMFDQLNTLNVLGPTPKKPTKVRSTKKPTKKRCIRSR